MVQERPGALRPGEAEVLLAGRARRRYSGRLLVLVQIATEPQVISNQGAKNLIWQRERR